MTHLQLLETIMVSGRQVHIVKNDRERPRDGSDLKGKPIQVGNRVCVVTGIGSHCIIAPLREGENFEVFVRDPTVDELRWFCIGFYSELGWNDVRDPEPWNLFREAEKQLIAALGLTKETFSGQKEYWDYERDHKQQKTW